MVNILFFSITYSYVFSKYLRIIMNLTFYVQWKELHFTLWYNVINLISRIDDNKRRRFASAFESSSVEFLEHKGTMFVMLNSMAMEGDNCNMCSQAEQSLQQISLRLNCTKVFIQNNCKFTISNNN